MEDQIKKALEKGEKDYIIGTKFISFIDNELTVNSSPFFNEYCALCVQVKEGGSAAIMATNGEWAEIVSKPENNTGANDYTDFEKDKRYLEILDEEANNSISVYGWYLSKETIKNFSSTKLSAQRRYFTELLKEKDKTNAYQLELNQSLLIDKINLMLEIDQLTATIAERDKDINAFKEVAEYNRGFEMVSMPPNTITQI